MGLSVTILLVLAAVFAVGSDDESDSSLSTITDRYDDGESVLQVTSYAGMALCALLVFLGVALRTALRARRQPWTADVGDARLHGDRADRRRLGGLRTAPCGTPSTTATTPRSAPSTSATPRFLPLMASMIAIYVGAGWPGWRRAAAASGSPIASVVVG